MKQGSADDPFADDSSGDDADDKGSDATESEPDNGVPETEQTVAEQQRSTGGPSKSRRSLPYIHSRDGVKDGRTQRPVFLRDHIETGIDELVTQMEAEFGEDVYKTDVTEAAMAVAQEHPDLVQEKLDEWGYGWS